MLELNNLKTQLNEIYNNLAKIKQSDSKRIHNYIIELEKLLLYKELKKENEEELVNLFSSKLSVFQHYYELFETNLEIEFAKEIQSNKIKLADIKNYLLHNRFVELIKNEIELAKITKEDHILFIGSGPYPITAILINQFTGCNVDCYDEHIKHCEISERIIEELGLDQVRIFNKQGQSLDRDYDVIIIALLAKPKDEILKNAKQVASEKSRIICRTSDGVREFFYEKTNSSVFDSYKIINKKYAQGDQTISSILLKKES